jgi:hypothetical protein
MQRGPILRRDPSSAANPEFRLRAPAALTHAVGLKFEASPGSQFFGVISLAHRQRRVDPCQSGDRYNDIEFGNTK